MHHKRWIIFGLVMGALVVVGALAHPGRPRVPAGREWRPAERLVLEERRRAQRRVSPRGPTRASACATLRGHGYEGLGKVCPPA